MFPARANTERLDLLREEVFRGDNEACFIERERLLRNIPTETPYPEILHRVLSQLSTPIGSNDIFLGRMVEGRLPQSEQQRPAACMESHGHLCLDWDTLLSKGLSGVAAEIEKRAKVLGDARSLEFSQQAKTCINAVAIFARNYAKAARLSAQTTTTEQRRVELLRAADALEHCPEHPAKDFFSALQSVWIVHLVTSCVIGSRDFAFGRMDRWLAPFYNRDLRAGRLDKTQATRWLAHFFMKTNQITGTCAHNYCAKPIPSQSSKQYLVIGGIDEMGRETDAELGQIILDAALLTALPQPVLVVRLHPDMSPALHQAACAAVCELGGQLNFVNDEVVIPAFQTAGLPLEEARDYSLTGCVRPTLAGRMDWGSLDSFHNLAAWMLEALDRACATPPQTFAGVLAHCQTVFSEAMQHACQSAEKTLIPQPGTFHFESLLLDDCPLQCRDYAENGVRYRPHNHLWGGIGTVVNSLHAIKHFVYDEKLLSLRELLHAAQTNFKGAENLRCQIKRLSGFGNDSSDADEIAKTIGDFLVTALDSQRNQCRGTLLGGFYSLWLHHQFGRDISGTPDGRLAGDPVSENQSPIYGTDRQGTTALLKSVAKLPFNRAPLGGLNITFSHPVPPADIASLLDSYCQLGGLLVGFTFISRDTLQNAQREPEKYRSLCVRLYGFSEYFTALSLEEQDELLEQTRG